MKNKTISLLLLFLSCLAYGQSETKINYTKLLNPANGEGKILRSDATGLWQEVLLSDYQNWIDEGGFIRHRQTGDHVVVGSDTEFSGPYNSDLQVRGWLFSGTTQDGSPPFGTHLYTGSSYDGKIRIVTDPPSGLPSSYGDPSLTFENPSEEYTIGLEKDGQRLTFADNDLLTTKFGQIDNQGKWYFNRYNTDNIVTGTANRYVGLIDTTSGELVLLHPDDLPGGGGGGTDDQVLSTDNSPGNISIESGNTIALNVNDADASATNELITGNIHRNDSIFLVENGAEWFSGMEQGSGGGSNQDLQSVTTQGNTTTDTIIAEVLKSADDIIVGANSESGGYGGGNYLYLSNTIGGSEAGFFMRAKRTGSAQADNVLEIGQRSGTSHRTFIEIHSASSTTGYYVDMGNGKDGNELGRLGVDYHGNGNPVLYSTSGDEIHFGDTPIFPSITHDGSGNFPFNNTRPGSASPGPPGWEFSNDRYNTGSLESRFLLSANGVWRNYTNESIGMVLQGALQLDDVASGSVTDSLLTLTATGEVQRIHPDDLPGGGGGSDTHMFGNDLAQGSTRSHDLNNQETNFNDFGTWRYKTGALTQFGIISQAQLFWENTTGSIFNLYSGGVDIKDESGAGFYIDDADDAIRIETNLTATSTRPDGSLLQKIGATSFENEYTPYAFPDTEPGTGEKMIVWENGAFRWQEPYGKTVSLSTLGNGDIRMGLDPTDLNRKWDLRGEGGLDIITDSGNLIRFDATELSKDTIYITIHHSELDTALIVGSRGDFIPIPRNWDGYQVKDVDVRVGTAPTTASSCGVEVIQPDNSTYQLPSISIANGALIGTASYSYSLQDESYLRLNWETASSGATGLSATIMIVEP